MKTILICPNQASGVPALADSKPLVTLPMLGEPFICHWLEHLSGRGIKEARILTNDDGAALEEAAGDGSRWGMKLVVTPETRDLTAEEARKLYRGTDESGWPIPPEDVTELDSLPGMKGRELFRSYREWFQGICEWMQLARGNAWLGMREIRPGVWAGRGSKVAASARLRAPCWIGDHVRVGRNAAAGPFAYLEDRVVVDEAAEVANSWVGPDTFVGELTRVQDSLAWGSRLINWEMGSWTDVPDQFLMSSLAKPGRHGRASKRAVARKEAPAPRPLEAVISFAQKIQG